MRIESFDGQKDGEKIIKAWRQHTWVMSRCGFIFAGLVLLGSIPLAFSSFSWATGFLLFFVAVAGIYLILQIYLYLSTIYLLTNERLLSISQSKLLVRSINEVPLRNIQNVSHIRKGLFQMLMDYGNVEIQTAGATTAMKLKDVAHPYLVQQKILAREERIKKISLWVAPTDRILPFKANKVILTAILTGDSMEKTLVIIKPDAVSRGLTGDVIKRFEQKGLKIVAMKMKYLADKELEDHYAHHKGKPFFKDLIDFMKHAPSILVILEGNRAIDVVRSLAGPTYGVEAVPGTIRGDYSMSQSNNIVHASDSTESAVAEIERFFTEGEIFEWEKIDFSEVYAIDERG